MKFQHFFASINNFQGFKVSIFKKVFVIVFEIYQSVCI